MAAQTPRSIVKAFMRGEPLPRPLLAPIIFSLGARLENLPLRDFLSNATRITNALRQIRSTLKVDGLCCYFDPFLAAEALACKREWVVEGSSGSLFPSFTSVEDLREKCGSLEQLSSRGSTKVAGDVLQRLKVMLKDEPALMVGVAGPYTLASQLIRGSGQSDVGENPELLEFAADVTAAVAKSLLESAADIIFFLEQQLPDLSTDFYEHWASLFSPILNVVQFYEALPVLVLSKSAITSEKLPPVVSNLWGGIWSPLLGTAQTQHWDSWRAHGGHPSLAMNLDLSGEPPGPDVQQSATTIGEFAASQSPLLLSSFEDMSPTLDLKHLAITLELLRSNTAGN